MPGSVGTLDFGGLQAGLFNVLGAGFFISFFAHSCRHPYLSGSPNAISAASRLDASKDRGDFISSMVLENSGILPDFACFSVSDWLRLICKWQWRRVHILGRRARIVPVRKRTASSARSLLSRKSRGKDSAPTTTERRNGSAITRSRKAGRWSKVRADTAIGRSRRTSRIRNSAAGITGPHSGSMDL